MNAPRFLLYLMTALSVSVAVSIVRQILYMPKKNQNYPVNPELD